MAQDLRLVHESLSLLIDTVGTECDLVRAQCESLLLYGSVDPLLSFS